MDKFSALADPTRRQIIEQLAAKGTLNASQLGQPFTMSAPAISQHLKVLREAEVVIMHKQGQQRLYTINPAAFNEMEQWLHQVRQFWNDSFDALDTMLARNEKESLSLKAAGKPTLSPHRGHETDDITQNSNKEFERWKNARSD